MLTVVSGEGSGHEGGKDHAPSPIDEIVRERARRMLAEALQAEVDVYIARFADQRDENGRRLTRLTGQWKAEQRAFAARDLSQVDYVYLWADGIHVNIRLEVICPELSGQRICG